MPEGDVALFCEGVLADFFPKFPPFLNYFPTAQSHVFLLYKATEIIVQKRRIHNIRVGGFPVRVEDSDVSVMTDFHRLVPGNIVGE
jgi:hypothetical protein